MRGDGDTGSIRKGRDGSSSRKGSDSSGVRRASEVLGQRKDSITSGLKIKLERQSRGSRASLDSKLIDRESKESARDDESAMSSYDGVARTQFKSAKRL